MSIGILSEIRFVVDREDAWKIFMKELSIWIKMVHNQYFQMTKKRQR